jgi:hypothetical protein
LRSGSSGISRTGPMLPAPCRQCLGTAGASS